MPPTAGPHDPRDRPGVRANALPAARFVPLSTVDARVSDAVLDVLEDAGVAAYVEPTVGEVGPYRDVRSPTSPKQSLYVDARLSDVAEALLRVELPGLLAELDSSPTVDDQLFAAIIAGFDHDPVGPDAGRPSADQARLRRDSDDDASSARAPVAESDDDDHFVPPPPPPLPALRGLALWGTLALAASFAVLVLLPMFGVDNDGRLVVGILLATAGVAALLWQMRDGPPTDSGPDDGAVI
jgi:hypothetical protein